MISVYHDMGDQHGYSKVILSRGNLRTVSLGIGIPIGSTEEKIPGIGSVLLNHLQRNTTKKTDDQYADYIDNLGITTFGSAGRTNLSLGVTCPPQNLKKALDLLNEMLFEYEFKEDSIQQITQRQVGSIQQIKSTPESILTDFTRWTAAYKDDKIVKHPLGTPDALKEINVEDLNHWHQEILSYKPHFAAVGIDISEEKMNNLGLDSFLNQFGSKVPSISPITASKQQLRIQIDQPPMESANAYIGVNLRGVDPRKSNMEDDLFISVLSGGSSSRLFTEIREKRNLSYAPRVMPSRFFNGSFMTAMMDVRPDRSIEALETTLNTLHDTLVKPIPQDELDRAIKSALKIAVFVADSSYSYVSFLLSRMMTGKEYNLDTLKEKIMRISTEDWQDRVLTNWTKENLSLAVSGEAGDVADKWLEKVEMVI